LAVSRNREREEKGLSLGTLEGMNAALLHLNFHPVILRLDFWPPEQ
jgi:hypothetical protein